MIGADFPVVDPDLQFNVREIGDIAVGHYTTIRYFLMYDSSENKVFIKAFHDRWGTTRTSSHTAPMSLLR